MSNELSIYFVSQNQNTGYDTFDSFVCVAASEEDARRMFPSCSEYKTFRWAEDGRAYERFEPAWGWETVRDWAFDLSAVKVQRIGTASPGETPRVVIASFNAG